MAKKLPSAVANIDYFDFKPGRIVARKYEILSKLGEGWESEVYRVRERKTGIVRAAKFFFPQRNPRETVSKRHAQKLHKLRHCPIIVQYHTEETITVQRQPITFLVSDYVEGQPLKVFLEHQTGGRLTPFEGLHLLHALARGVEKIHAHREYHGDIHSENIMVARYGIGFELKLLDFFHWDFPKQENINDDVIDLIRLFYDSIGGQYFYARQPKFAKNICCGLRRSLIRKKYRTAGQLRRYLEAMKWD